MQRISLLIASLTAILWIASCQAQSRPISTDTAAPPPATSTRPPADAPTSSPSPAFTATHPPTETPEITPSPTYNPEITETLALTRTATGSNAICFTPADLNLFAFMPDSERILVRTGTGIQIFNLMTLEEDRFIKAPKNILTAAISPDGQTLAWSLEDNSLQLVRVSDQKILSTMQGHTDIVFKLRFSPSGDRLYSASHDTWVRIWDINGEEVGAFQPTGADDLPSEVLGIGISPDGTQLASIPFDGPVKLWDINEKKQAAVLGGSGGFDTSDAVFSPDGQYVAADLATGLYLWSYLDGTPLWDDLKNSMAVSFSPDGRFLAYSNIGENNDIILSSPDGAQTIRVLSGHQGPVWELVFSPDSSLLASTDGMELRIWNAEDGELLYVGKAACP